MQRARMACVRRDASAQRATALSNRTARLAAVEENHSSLAFGPETADIDGPSSRRGYPKTAVFGQRAERRRRTRPAAGAPIAKPIVRLRQPRRRPSHVCASPSPSLATGSYRIAVLLTRS